MEVVPVGTHNIFSKTPQGFKKAWQSLRWADRASGCGNMYKGSARTNGNGLIRVREDPQGYVIQDHNTNKYRAKDKK